MVSWSPRLTRRSLMVGAAWAGVTPAFADESASLSFLVIGDWGDPHLETQRAVAAAMGDVASRLGSDFVISTGDNFYSNGVRSTHDPQWQETFERVYTAPSLQTPWYVVLGNHDYNGSPTAEIDYSAISPRWRMPARYWRNDTTLPDGSVAAFFFIDTTPIAHLRGLRDAIPQADLGARDQIMWLERELAACTAPWKIVVGHHPIFSSGAHGASPGIDTHIRPLLERYGVQAYFNGHDHDLEHLSEGRVSYICSGSGSEARPVRSPAPQSRFTFDAPGFVACTLTRDVLDVSFFDAAGVQRYTTAITRV
ncbi:MAG: metallophosphoesterase [Hyphomonadaceae bacterium]|nr:metallophosphoesterase [Hyphomonadaceae bacterium]